MSHVLLPHCMHTCHSLIKTEEQSHSTELISDYFLTDVSMDISVEIIRVKRLMWMMVIIKLITCFPF